MRRSYTSKTKRRTFVKKSHTRRNISILATLVVMVMIVVALSGAFSPPAPTYIMIVHVYDETKGTPQTVYNYTEAMVVHNVTVTVSGPNYPATTRGPSREGIVGWGPDDHLLSGSYQITVSAGGYVTRTVTYVLGPNCIDRTPDEQCHPLVPMLPQ